MHTMLAIIYIVLYSLATGIPPTTPPTVTPPIGGDKLYVQLRILELQCSQWRVSTVCIIIIADMNTF